MIPNPTTPDAVRVLVDAGMREIADAKRVGQIAPLLRPAVEQTLYWEYGNNEPFVAWRFADLGERDVWAAYCAGGHGALGYPWGLVFSDRDDFGMDCGWYRTLAKLFEDWF